MFANTMRPTNVRASVGIERGPGSSASAIVERAALLQLGHFGLSAPNAARGVGECEKDEPEDEEEHVPGVETLHASLPPCGEVARRYLGSCRGARK